MKECMNKYRLMNELLKGGSITQIAKNLSVSRSTVYAQLKRYGDVTKAYQEAMEKQINTEANMNEKQDKIINSLSYIASGGGASSNIPYNQRLKAAGQLISMTKLRRKTSAYLKWMLLICKNQKKEIGDYFCIANNFPLWRSERDISFGFLLFQVVQLVRI